MGNTCMHMSVLKLLIAYLIQIITTVRKRRVTIPSVATGEPHFSNKIPLSSIRGICTVSPPKCHTVGVAFSCISKSNDSAIIQPRLCVSIRTCLLVVTLNLHIAVLILKQHRRQQVCYTYGRSTLKPKHETAINTFWSDLTWLKNER